MAGLRIRVITLGCKVNQCDGEEIARALAARGHRVVGRENGADVYVINTCTVTATADAKARKLIRKIHRQQPGARIIVTGCLAERDAEAVAGLPGVSAVVPNARKGGLPSLLSDSCPAEAAGVGTPALQPRRTRAFVKVQDGCDHHCTYCIVPHVRGAPASKPMSEVLEEMRGFARGGAQEVVLCGIRLGAYGRDLGEGSLAILLRELREIEIPRLRLSSIEPMDFSEDLVAEIADFTRLRRASPRLCHHLHLPLQSGDDGVLAAMGRGYTRERYAELVRAIRAQWPEVALSTDVMVGFPGESEEQFRRTVAFVREIGFSKLHVFPYSSRPGTPAARRAGQVSPAVKRERAARLLAIARELARAAAWGWMGRKVSVLFEEQDGDGCLSGLTEHYLRVRCRGPERLVGQIVEVVVVREENGEVIAELDE